MGRKNRLLNQVKRHAQTTTLFRQRDTAVSPTPAAPHPIPQATIHAGLENLPMGEVIGLSPVTAVPPTHPAPGPLADTLITRPQSSASARRPTSQPTSSPAPQLQPEPSSPASQPPASQPKENDPAWRRLSTIMRKHEEKRIAEEAAEQGEIIPSTNETPLDISRHLHDEGEEIASGDPATAAGETARGTAGGSAASGETPGIIGGDVNIGDDLSVGDSAIVSGKPQAEDSAAVSGSGGSGTLLDIKGDAQIGGLATAGTQIKKDDDISSSETVSAESKVSAGARVVTSGSDMTPGSSVQAGGDVEAGGSMNMDTTAVNDDDISSAAGLDGDATTKPVNDIAADSELMAGPAVDVVDDVNVDERGGIKATIDTQRDVQISESAAAGGDVGAGGNIITSGLMNAPVDGPPGSGTVQKKQDDAPTPSRPPLESAWPVERQETPAISPPAPVMEPVLPRHTPENAQMASVLQAVAAERPSDSSVEIIPPRRPRPANAPTLIQRMPEKTTSPKKPHENRQPDSFSAGPESVPTEIGPLPTDLWQLIGEEPPTVMRTAVTETQSETERSTAAQRPSMPPAPVTETPAPGQSQTPEETIQKTAVADDAPSPTETIGSSAETESDTNDETTEPDVDELARRVYGEIKRKLSVEWERMRGKR